MASGTGLEACGQWMDGVSLTWSIADRFVTYYVTNKITKFVAG